MYIIVAIVFVVILYFALTSKEEKPKDEEKAVDASETKKSNKISFVDTDNDLFMVFDTETGGVSAEQNDILQLSYQLVDRQTLKVVKTVNEFFAWPEDKSRVNEAAIRVNGLTENVLASKVLSKRKDAISRFFRELRNCQFVVAHNGDFDRKFVVATAKREGLPYSIDSWPLMIDTMKSTVELCKLHPHEGRTGYKWPKLIELAHCLNIKTSDINLHDASADVELTKRCFVFLLKHKFYNV